MFYQVIEKKIWLQFVDAKVHQLDFSLDRICLSLKELMVFFILFFSYVSIVELFQILNYNLGPLVWQADPLIESFEAAFADHDSLGGRLQEAQADTEVFNFVPYNQ